MNLPEAIQNNPLSELYPHKPLQLLTPFIFNKLCALGAYPSRYNLLAPASTRALAQGYRNSGKTAGALRY